tara:strand:+ start:772 stop:2043 length:1272 start_codon:yes stop_codon:yes gene_type:complete
MSEHSQKTPFIKASSQDQYGKIPLKSWVGKVVSYEAQKDQIEDGWGWRYKVRILGDDSNSQNVADQELSYAICLLPTTAGSGAAYKLRSVRVSQGDMVYGIYGGDGPRLIIGVFPRTALTDTTSGNFGTLSGFYGDLEDNGILDGEYNGQVGPATPGATALDPKEWTKATANNPSEKVKELVPVKKNEDGEFQQITEEETEKNDVKNTAGKVNDAWKPGDNLNTATMEYLKESFEKGELPPETWEAALKQAEEQGIVGYEEYVVKAIVNEEVNPKKVEYKQKITDKINEKGTFDEWERSVLTADNNKGKITYKDDGRLGIDIETNYRILERQDILKEINSLEQTLRLRSEISSNQTIQIGDNAPVNLQKSLLNDSETGIKRDKLLHLYEQKAYIENGGIVRNSDNSLNEEWAKVKYTEQFPNG